MILEDISDQAVIAFAFRYSLGRHSYAASLMRRKLDEVWASIDPDKRTLILNEIQNYVTTIRECSLLHNIRECYVRDSELQDAEDWMHWRTKKLQEMN